MTAHAIQIINSGFGTFVKGDRLAGIPDVTVAAWVAAGIAAYDPEPEAVEPVDPAPEPIAKPVRRPHSRKTTRKVSAHIDA